MAEASVTPEASTVRVGKDLRYIGDYAYAYSGSVAIGTSAFVTLLEFTTGSGIISAKLQPQYMDDDLTGDNLQFRFILNGSRMAQVDMDQSAIPYGIYPLILLLPPLTDFQVTCQQMSGSGTTNGAVVMTGRIYGAE